MKVGIYPGSFDPVTIGHLDVMQRSASIVDKLIVGVLDNHAKNNLFTAEERVNMIRMVMKEFPNVEVESFCGLLVDFARVKKADIIVRGLRATSDFEYELQMAQTNYKLNQGIDTIFLATNVEYSYLSSTLVKEIASFNGPIESFLPSCIVDTVKEKFKMNNET
ncbi:MAG: pantetheine-phosphate adenylyltransferase [Lachnoclostridium sp.]|jgi:pantetheine-phosphate adenylyltransferase|nr:pantetheine-phosphate adenylyltransferase [Lachnoclostridium sp.]